MSKTLLAFLLMSLTAGCQSQVRESRLVQIRQGPVRGYKASDGNYFAFLGIPYATEPIGKDKFKAPLPEPTWKETFEAVDAKTICPQIIPIQDETKYVVRNNCLVANVFVPNNTKKTMLPVVVYVHGGGFYEGAGIQLFPAGLLTRGNFIAVNFNYRLGVHGFLCLGTEQVPGNAGMKDMVALLRWVQRNIRYFGGNPHDVTIDGASAGSTAADLLMISPVTKGLFHKVIAESGSALAVWSVQIDPLKNAQFFAGTLGSNADTVNELENYFTSLTLDEITSITLHLTLFNDSTLRAVPCVERPIEGVNSFITESVWSILKRGDFPKIPYLVGFTKREAILILDLFEQRKSILNNNFSEFMPADLVFPNNQEREAVASSIKRFYFGSQIITDQSIYEYIAFFGALSFVYPTLRSVKAMAEAGSNSIYLYEYKYSDQNLETYQLPNSSVTVYGPGHCAQTFELLELIPDVKLSWAHLNVRNTLRRVWINFIRTGKPLSTPTLHFFRGWPPASVAGSPHMIFDSPSYLGGIPRPRETAFWDDIYNKYYREPIPPPGITTE